MVWNFDPRKLVKDQQEEENKKIEDVIMDQEKLDLFNEEKEKALRKRSNIREGLESAVQIVREFKFRKKHGDDAYHDAKLEQDSSYRDPRLYTDEENKKYYRQEIESMRGMFKGATIDWDTFETVWPDDKKPESVETKYGKKDEEGPTFQLASYKGDGTTGLVTTESINDPFSGDVGLIESLGYAVVSGGLKIPYGFMNLGAMILDYADKNDLPVDQSRVAQLERWWEQTFAGEVMKFSEAKAKENAIGRITEVLVQMYGGWASIGKKGVGVTDEAFRMFNNAWDAVKSGKYVKTAKNTNLSRGVKEVKKFNNLSKKQKFTSIAVGGGLSASVVYDEENIGTFGDLAQQFGMLEEGEFTALDRKQRSTAKEDATRMLYNKLKFSGEMGFPIIPAIWGVGKVGKNIVSGTFKRAANTTKFDRVVEKYVSRPFRARSQYPEEQFQAAQRLTGKKESAKLLSEDFLKNIDNIVKRLSKDTQIMSSATGLTDGISSAMVKLINNGAFRTSKGKIISQGFDPKAMKSFRESLTKLSIPKKEILNIENELHNIHQYWTQYMNTIAKGGNLNIGLKEFTKLINERIGDSLATEYKIFADRALEPIDGYVVSRQIKDEVAEIFRRNYAANVPGKVMSKTEARLIVNEVIKNVRLDPLVGQPYFKFPAVGMAAEKALITKSIAKNITAGGKFVADDVGGLIQKESDLRAFQKLFGGYKDANNLIANVTTDLAHIAARDRYYNIIKQSSDAMIKRGERGLVYPNYIKAAEGWRTTGQKIIEKSSGLKLPKLLGEKSYTNPLDGMFTTETIEQGLIHGSKNLIPFGKSALYQATVMVPKGLIQMGKTVGGPFTHARNFSSGAATMVALGNARYAVTHPLVFGKALWRALNTIQPQILWRNKPGVNYTAGANVNASELKKGGQALYRFLLDEGMVNTNAIYRDVIGLVEETQKLGWLKNMLDKPKNWAQKIVKKAQDLYVAEDDIWKIANFFIEDQKLHNAYARALKKGLIRGNEIPSDLEIMKMATKKIREFMPNYAYVSDVVQATRRSPFGNFTSWPAEQIRTNTNIVTESLKEAKHPIFGQIGSGMGAERLTSWGITVGTMGPLAVWGGMQLYGITKEKLYAIKEFLPWFSKDSTVIPVYEDGQYKYIDFSRAFFYDVVSNPLQSVITSLEQGGKDDPVLPLVAKGLATGFARLAEPFVSESIYLSGLFDLYARGGVTSKGTKIWNEEDSPGDKIYKAMKHLAVKFSPGSLIQMNRLYHAIEGKTLKGTEYEVSDELLGLIGMRKAPLDIYRSMQINVGKFLKREANQRSVIYEGTLSGDPVEDETKLIKQFIWGNRQRLDAFNEMRRLYDAAITLDFPEKDIKEIFEKRNRMDIYEMVKRNKFKPIEVSDNMRQLYKDLAERKGINNPLTKDIERTMNAIAKELYKYQGLNEDYIIKLEDYIDKPSDQLPEGLLGGEEVKVQTPPLPPTSMPVANNVQMASAKDPQTNLTRTEEALLSPTEKIIAGRT